MHGTPNVLAMDFGNVFETESLAAHPLLLGLGRAYQVHDYQGKYRLNRYHIVIYFNIYL